MYIRIFINVCWCNSIYTLIYISVGSSFITNGTGEILAKAPREVPGIVISSLDIHKCTKDRAAWGLFRDRRVDLYTPILTKDGGI